MGMIDILGSAGVVLEISNDTTTDPTKRPTTPVAKWQKLNGCNSTPDLMSAPDMISYDYLGDEYTGEYVGKKSISSMSFEFAYDGTADDTATYKFCLNSEGSMRWLRITLPDGTKIEYLCQYTTSIDGLSPSSEITFQLTLAVYNPTRVAGTGNAPYDSLVNIVQAGELDPLQTTP